MDPHRLDYETPEPPPPVRPHGKVVAALAWGGHLCVAVAAAGTYGRWFGVIVILPLLLLALRLYNASYERYRRDGEPLDDDP